MTSLLVFDPEPKGVLEWDEDEASVAVGGSDASVLVFDPPGDRQVVDGAEIPSGVIVLDRVQTDVLIGDPNSVTTVVAPDDHPDVVVLDDEGVELLVVTPSGMRGARGEEGPQGDPSTIPGPKGDTGDGAYDDMPDLTLLFENKLI